MKKISYLIITLAGALMLQSCTIAHFKMNNQFTTATLTPPQKREIAYYVAVTGEPLYGTLTSEYSPKALERMRSRYCKSTQKVFEREGVSALSTTNKCDADFLIDVKATPWRSALPQEFLTGLSFGLIPSWGTRHKEYTYTFEQVGMKKAHSYYIDSKSYNHLVLFPVFLVNVITMDESRIYRKSLNNYLTKE